jgi:uncharacterized membrane protein HdeD (DUF308 family)
MPPRAQGRLRAPFHGSLCLKGMKNLANASRRLTTHSRGQRHQDHSLQSLQRAYVISHPALGVASLTLVLASLFLVEGILNIALFFRARSVRGSGWLLIDGIVTLLLGLMIYMQWPSSSVWAIGTLVGVSMIISGVTRVMLSLAVRKAADTFSSKLAA